MKLFFSSLLLILPLAVAGQSNQTNHDLVFTEIMADPDPAVGLPVEEYCEIYNRGSVAINLSGWSFYDGSSKQFPSITINPGEYLIICDDGDTALFSAYGKCAAISSISLTNSGEKLSLRNDTGQPVDSVIFSDEWYQGSVKKDGGWSLERVDIHFDCPIPENWLPSTDSNGGTPGKNNSVNGIITDDSPPLLIRSYCQDSASLVLLFNEPLDPDQAVLLQHYSLSHSLHTISAEPCDPFLKKFKLTFDTPLYVGVIYSVTVSGITDCSGNEIQPAATTRFGIYDSESPQNLKINEILFDPFTGGYDFIELYNAGTGISDLSRTKILSFDLETGMPDIPAVIQDDPFLVFPGDLVVITENPEAVAQHYRSSYPLNFVIMENMPSMNVDEGHIAIMQDEKIIDSFHYSEDYHFDLIDDVKGISLEKINPLLLSGDRNSWHSAAESAGFATPGLINSEYSTIEETENEIHLSPEIFSPDNDGNDDIITITLHTSRPGYILNLWIYSMDGKIISDYAKNRMLATSDYFIWNGITDSGEKAPAGIYIAVVEIFNLKGDVKKHNLPFVLATKL